MKEASLFGRLARGIARAAGRPMTFAIALGLIVLWLASGPYFGFSDTWQLVINTGTTIVTFLMVFLIQNTQTRDTDALHVKLDELIRAVKGASTALLDLEEVDEADLDRIHKSYKRLAKVARNRRGELKSEPEGGERMEAAEDPTQPDQE
jgi:low affinity Fe/Cu permease